MKNRFLIATVILSAVLSVSRIGVEALQITAPTFVAPIFKTVFFKAGGDDSQAAGVQLDEGGIYVSDAAIQGQSNALRLSNDGTFVRDFVSNSSFESGSISSINIINGSITTTNLTNVTITANNIQNNSLTINNFDPNIVWPTGQHYYTNSICSAGTAITSVSNGNVTCSVLTGFSVASIPNCGAGGTLVFSGGVWDCQVVLLSSSTITDAYWTGGNGLVQNIRNTNGTNSAIAQGACTPGVNCVAGNGNIGIGISSPSKTLTVSGSLKVMGNSDEALYCYATDTWLPISSFNESACAGCQQGFALSGSSCTQVSCTTCNGSGCTTTLVNTGTAGVCGSSHTRSYTSAPSTNLCSGGSATLVTARTTGWTWSCTGTGGSSTNASCYANNSSPINGVCGNANTNLYYTASEVNAAGLCTVGTANPVSGNGPWSWSCIGYNTGHSNSSCNAGLDVAQVDGSCGPASDSSHSTAASVNAAGLCADGTPSPSSVAGSGPWYWDCLGAGSQGSDTSCTADYSPAAAAGVCGSTANTCSVGSSTSYNAGSCGGNATWSCMGTNGGATTSCSKANAVCNVNGACGTANGKTYSAASYVNAAGLCSAGNPTPSTVVGAGPWSWQCAGIGAGSDAQCSASIPTPINGVCDNTTENKCAAGTLGSTSSAGCTYTWSCNGINGGTNATNCTKTYTTPTVQYSMANDPSVYTGGSAVCVNKTLAIVGSPSGGVWSTTTPSIISVSSTGVINTLSVGTASFSYVTSAPRCNARNGSISIVSCSSAANGVCGSANGTTTSSAPSSNLCSAGTAGTVTSTGSGWGWNCAGSNGGSSSSCIAYLPKAKITSVQFNLTNAGSWNMAGNCTVTMDVSNLTPTAGSIQANTTYYKVGIEAYDDYQDCAQIGGGGGAGCTPITSRAAFTCDVNVKGQDMDFQPNPAESRSFVSSTNQLGRFQYQNDPSNQVNANGRMPNIPQGSNSTFCVINPSKSVGAQYNYTIDPSIDICD